MAAKDDVLKAVYNHAGGVCPAALAHELGMTGSSVRARLSELAYAGFIRKHGNAYVVTGKGALKLPTEK